MSETHPVTFPVGNSGYDDLQQGLSYVLTVHAALCAGDNGNLSPGALQAARYVLGDAINFLEAAAGWAVDAHNAECQREIEEHVVQTAARRTPSATRHWAAGAEARAKKMKETL